VYILNYTKNTSNWVWIFNSKTTQKTLYSLSIKGSVLHQETNKIGFAFLWYFYDFWWIFEVAANNPKSLLQPGPRIKLHIHKRAPAFHKTPFEDLNLHNYAVAGIGETASRRCGADPDRVGGRSPRGGLPAPSGGEDRLVLAPTSRPRWCAETASAGVQRSGDGGQSAGRWGPRSVTRAKGSCWRRGAAARPAGDRTAVATAMMRGRGLALLYLARKTTRARGEQGERGEDGAYEVVWPIVRSCGASWPSACMGARRCAVVRRCIAGLGPRPVTCAARASRTGNRVGSRPNIETQVHGDNFTASVRRSKAGTARGGAVRARAHTTRWGAAQRRRRPKSFVIPFSKFRNSTNCQLSEKSPNIKVEEEL
jgi:hypothetical protein